MRREMITSNDVRVGVRGVCGFVFVGLAFFVYTYALSSYQCQIKIAPPFVARCDAHALKMACLAVALFCSVSGILIIVFEHYGTLCFTRRSSSQ